MRSIIQTQNSKNLRAASTSMFRVGGDIFLKAKICPCHLKHADNRSNTKPQKPSRSFNQHVKGRGRRFSQVKLPVPLKARELSQLRLACARWGRRFSSEIICPCCLKHVVTKPKQPSLIPNHHEPSRETFFQSPAAEANKNCHHAQSKCRKPQKRRQQNKHSDYLQKTNSVFPN